MTPAQCRAGRALLSWTQADLSRTAAVGIVTVRQFERGTGFLRDATLARIKAALEDAGVTLDLECGIGLGVRFEGYGNDRDSDRRGQAAKSRVMNEFKTNKLDDGQIEIEDAAERHVWTFRREREGQTAIAERPTAVPGSRQVYHLLSQGQT